MTSASTHTGNVFILFLSNFSSFKIKKKPNTPVTTAAAAKAKSNSSSKKT